MELTEREQRDLTLLRKIREAEADAAAEHIPPGARVLEIGAGAGWQARHLAERGFRVVAIDVAGNPYSLAQEWPITPYDGRSIPFEDGSVDVVFSSNVLEHIRDVKVFQQEIRRVLKPEGKAIHILPTPSWLLWRALVMYPATARKVLDRRHRWEIPGGGGRPRPSATSWWRHAPGNLWPVRHGEVGNSLTEFYYFSQHRWTKLFESTGWRIERVERHLLFYTDHFLLGDLLTIRARQHLSWLLGSACFLYVLRQVPH